ncbi:hypothetical protein BKA83DRAFT_4178589 [Pisolithus microcarpus]|nr:hypothetical protein BKA83DRAFT_4178589 [Pisolithus microcarpus]
MVPNPQLCCMFSPHQQSHSSHTHAYSRATELDHGYPLPNPRLNEEPIIPVYHMYPQYGHPPPFVHETSQIPPPGRPNSRSPPTPEQYAFRFPTRPLVWTPDPCSPRQRPYAPAASSLPAPVQHRHQQHPPAPAPPPASSVPGHPPPPPHDPYAAAAAHPLGGCWPFYGICYPWCIPQWSPASWLIPNLVNPYVPQLEWDVSRHPSMTRHVTGAHVTILRQEEEGVGARARE